MTSTTIFRTTSQGSKGASGTSSYDGWNVIFQTTRSLLRLIIQTVYTRSTGSKIACGSSRTFGPRPFSRLAAQLDEQQELTHLCLWQLYPDDKDHHESNPITENDCIYALCALPAAPCAPPGLAAHGGVTGLMLVGGLKFTNKRCLLWGTW